MIVMQRHDFAGNPDRFVCIIHSREMNDFILTLHTGEQILIDTVAVILDQCIRTVQNLLGGTVVLIQHNGMAVRKIPFKIHNDIHLCTTPGINRLIGIADHAQIAAFLYQQLDDGILQIIDILKLIDMQIREAALPFCAYLFLAFQYTVGKNQQIIEIQRIHFLQALLVKLVDIGLDLFTRPFAGTRLGCCGINKIRFVVAYVRQHTVVAVAFDIDMHLLVGIPQDALLIICIQNREISRISQLQNVLPQQTYAKGVNGGNRNRLGYISQQIFHSLFHFSSRLIRKGDG